MKIVLRLMSLK